MHFFPPRTKCFDMDVQYLGDVMFAGVELPTRRSSSATRLTSSVSTN